MKKILDTLHGIFNLWAIEDSTWLSCGLAELTKFVALLWELHQFCYLLEEVSFDRLNSYYVLVEVRVVCLYVYLQIFFELKYLIGWNRDEPGIQVIWQILEHSFYLSSLHFVALDFLFDRRGS